MEEHSQREEPLSEELLEWVTGARSDPSFYKCPDCQEALAEYRHHIQVRNVLQADAHAAMAEGAPEIADEILRISNVHHQAAQEYSVQLAAHHHPNPPWSPLQD